MSSEDSKYNTQVCTGTTHACQSVRMQKVTKGTNMDAVAVINRHINRWMRWDKPRFDAGGWFFPVFTRWDHKLEDLFFFLLHTGAQMNPAEHGELKLNFRFLQDVYE